MLLKKYELNISKKKKKNCKMKIMGLNSSKSYNYIRKAVLKRTKRKKYITTSILAQLSINVCCWDYMPMINTVIEIYGNWYFFAF